MSESGEEEGWSLPPDILVKRSFILSLLGVEMLCGALMVGGSVVSLVTCASHWYPSFAVVPGGIVLLNALHDAYAFLRVAESKSHLGFVKRVHLLVFAAGITAFGLGIQGLQCDAASHLEGLCYGMRPFALCPETLSGTERGLALGMDVLVLVGGLLQSLTSPLLLVTAKSALLRLSQTKNSRSVAWTPSATAKIVRKLQRRRRAVAKKKGAEEEEREWKKPAGRREVGAGSALVRSGRSRRLTDVEPPIVLASIRSLKVNRTQESERKASKEVSSGTGTEERTREVATGTMLLDSTPSKPDISSKEARFDKTQKRSSDSKRWSEPSPSPTGTGTGTGTDTINPSSPDPSTSRS